MIDREHFPAIAQSARAALQSLNEFIRVQQAGRTPLLSDEFMYEFLGHRHALRQVLISAGCFDQHRVTVYPLEGPAHAALLILAAEVGADGESLPPQIEAFAVRLTQVVRVLDGLQPAPTNTIWYHGERSYSTDGKNLYIVNGDQDKFLQAFLRRQGPLDTKALKDVGMSNPSATASQLRERFGPERVVKREGKGSGYFIRVRCWEPN